jgi:hypothetical protein
VGRRADESLFKRHQPSTEELPLSLYHRAYRNPQLALALSQINPLENRFLAHPFPTCGVLPLVANIDNRSATVLICKCSLLSNNIPIGTHTRNSTAPSLL